jgi:stress-induced morphogen
MTVETMKQRLDAAYPDGTVEVFDLNGQGSYYEVTIESQAFKGLNRVQQHQAVMGVFQAELKTGEVHALSIRTKIKE